MRYVSCSPLFLHAALNFWLFISNTCSGCMSVAHLNITHARCHGLVLSPLYGKVPVDGY